MAKNTSKLPDKKESEKVIRSIKELCDKLKECDKRLCEVSNVVKELDKVIGR